jgi:homoserine dehydrogenase
MHKTTNIILLGLGKVGRELVTQIQKNSPHLHIIAVADSKAFLSSVPLSAHQLETALQTKVDCGSIADVPGAHPLHQLATLYAPGTIIVDTSAARSLDLSRALTAGCKLVLANKNTHSAPWVQAQPFFHNEHVSYEATVGAGLPVIETLRSLVATGDEIIRIEGVMSGTLGFLCSQLENGASYSTAVRQAHEAGYTEPDPRDDLSGFDVARKALILARTAGWPLEKEQLQVEALYDSSLAGVDVTTFFEQMSSMDNAFTERVASAAAEGKVLRYMATITQQGGTVGLQAVPRNSSLGALQGPGNYIAFTTQRYSPIPLVIAGPGAGTAVTAAGVFADILNLTRE